MPASYEHHSDSLKVVRVLRAGSGGGAQGKGAGSFARRRFEQLSTIFPFSGLTEMRRFAEDRCLCSKAMQQFWGSSANPHRNQTLLLWQQLTRQGVDYNRSKVGVSTQILLRCWKSTWILVKTN